MVVKVSLMGPESCGKTTLAIELQVALTQRGIDSQIVAEYARHYYADKPYQVTMQDIEQIAVMQQQSEEREGMKNPAVLLCDTNLVTCKIWADVAFGAASPTLLDGYPPRYYDLNFLLAPDIAWQFDPLRSHPTQRDWLFELYEQELNQYGINYQVIKGEGKQRTDTALQAIIALLAQSKLSDIK